LIEPSYPEKARAVGIEGDIVFQGTIGKTGNLEQLQAIRWRSHLLAAALEAVKQWKYEPYHLNAEPAEIETTITFKFRLEP
jgi:protein TonB